ncbi:MAG: contact-dependent growth inhibition system immunity protein [Myxococcota bacterium]
MKAVGNLHKGPLAKFATCYHQDAQLCWSSFDDFVEEYLAEVDRGEAHALADEIRRLLDENPGRRGKGLRNALIRMGSGGPIPHGDNLRRSLERAMRLADAA